MQTLTIHKGFTLHIAGVPEMKTESVLNPNYVALLPKTIPHIKPCLLVHKGDRVSIGTPLCVDKQHEYINIVSPGAGIISDIEYGDRRSIEAIVIQLGPTETYVEIQPLSKVELEGISRDKLIEYFIKTGVWPFIRSLPFRTIANPETQPRFLIVSSNTLEPFHPHPEIFLHEHHEVFQLGLLALAKLPSEKLHVCSCDAMESSSIDIKGMYPADDPGSIVYHMKKSPEENRAWYVTTQDVIHLGQALKYGRYPIERTICIGGSKASKPMHIQTRAGVPISEILQHQSKHESSRYIAGGIFRGYTTKLTSYLGFYDDSLLIIEQGNKKEFLGFIRPGYDKPSFSRSFLSTFNRKPFPMDCNVHGDTRACISCGYCEQVCAVDILPQFMYKSLIADEIEEALAHGLLDCVECGLCTYVCPSKIELTTMFSSAKKTYHDEQG
ncbi:MAG: 4Fe-4S dicluster domain-containing protein [Desulfobacterales bacterium]|nr:4Fe-4S dicluster domain-containing protein [Desulfobacterales bacterium]